MVRQLQREVYRYYTGVQRGSSQSHRATQYSAYALKYSTRFGTDGGSCYFEMVNLLGRHGTLLSNFYSLKLGSPSYRHSSEMFSLAGSS